MKYVTESECLTHYFDVLMIPLFVRSFTALLSVMQIKEMNNKFGHCDPQQDKEYNDDYSDDGYKQKES